jgi:hypothetical protein
LPNPEPSAALLELLAERKENEAGQFVRDELSSGRLLRSLYLDVLGPTIEEASRRHRAGRLTAAQETFVGEATERIMASLAPLLFEAQGNPVRGAALCASFGTGNICRSADAAAAVLAIDGYEICNAGVAPQFHDLAMMIDELNPALCLFCLNAPNGWKSLARVLKSIAARPKSRRPYAVVVLPDVILAAPVLVAGANICVPSAMQAIDAARKTGVVASEA